ncbi:MAG: FAD-binding protein [Bacteroidetes bacterium]|nr:FAD-binding protein [Bacteroidota bacterium]
MNTITANGITYNLPASIADVQQLITQARQTNVEIRVRGAYHSVPPAISTDAGNAAGQPCINIMLSNLNAVSIDANAGTVTAQAGCHLGYDPFDPTEISTWENSLFYQLNQAGFAVPDMGGIIHQTVGGFLSTGSAGGSTDYSFNEQLISITFIPANTDNPEPVTVSINDADTDNFYAAGVSLGLLGIIVSATFKLVPRYCIQGNETITTIADCAVDMTGNGVTGKSSMRDFLLNTEYTRILWYPQPSVTKATVWQAKQIPYTDQNIVPYEELPAVNLFGVTTTIPVQIAADLVYTAIGKWPTWFGNIVGTNTDLYKGGVNFVNNNFYTPNGILSAILDLFVKPGVQNFLDYWYRSLPMDNNMSDKLFPVEFTELWIPFDATSPTDTVAQVLQTLNNLFNTIYADQSGPIPAGAFCTELYAAKPSKFWMSPANGANNVFRVDVFWFGNNNGSPADSFYPLFWNALQPYNFRCHWGKYLPAANSTQGTSYLQQQYPMWNKFMQLRQQYDPMQVFVNDYWRSQLGIPMP